jgi:hypothetical protein
VKNRGLLVVLLAAVVIVYFLFFAKVADDKSGLEIEVDKYLESKIKLTAVDLESLAREVLSYAAGGEGLPESLEDLRKLHRAAASRKDAWGRGFRYEKLSDSDFRLASAGPDGEFGTDDDVIKDY